MAFRCELLVDDDVSVVVIGAAEERDADWLVDTVIEGCDEAIEQASDVVLDCRGGRLNGAAGVVGELKRRCSAHGVGLSVVTGTEVR